MIDPTHLLNRLDEAPGGALTEDELEALLLWAREDKRQVEQIVEACGLDMGRLHHLYTVIEQRCRRETSPGAAILQALRAIQPQVAARPPVPLPEIPSVATRVPMLGSATTGLPVTATSAPLQRAVTVAPLPAAPTPEPAVPLSPVEALRAWLQGWLRLPPGFVAHVSEQRLMRILSRACSPPPRETERADIARLALIVHLVERRRDANLARCMAPDDVSSLHLLLDDTDDALHRMRVAVTRPEVRGMLQPDDFPDFAAVLSLFSDLEAILDRRAPGGDDLADHLTVDLERLRAADKDVRDAAAALVSVAQDLSLSREVALQFWGTHIVLGPTRLPVDDLPLSEVEITRAGMIAAMLVRAPDAQARQSLLAHIVAHHPLDAALLDAISILVERSGHFEARHDLRTALNLGDAPCVGTTVEAALKRNDPVAAEVALREVPDHHPAKVLLYCRTAWQLWKAGATRDAEALATRAMRIAPHEPLPLQSLARLRIEMGQYPAARRLLTTALRAAPDDLVTARMLIELESREHKGHHPAAHA
jgi:tetratricopeptide (TPR) repeat protein